MDFFQEVLHNYKIINMMDFTKLFLTFEKKH